MFVRSLLPDLNSETMLPAIDAVIMGRYNRYPEEYVDVFNVETSDRSVEQTTEVTGFGQFVQIPEAQDTRFDQLLPVYNKTYKHAQWSLGFKVSKQAAMNDKFNVVKKASIELGKSARETVEVNAANIYNQGFNSGYPGPDGLSLFSTAHILAGGGTQTNRLSYATDPDVTSIQLALTDMRNTVDHRGKKQKIVPKQLVFAPHTEFVVAELLGGTDRGDTANRTINAFRRRSGMPSFDSWMVYDYLTDPHAWMILADNSDTEVRFYWREKFNTVADVDFKSRSQMIAGWMQFSCGFNSFYGAYGVPSS
jgi:hypothetical protein